MVLAGAAFGGTYLYSSPELQLRLGLKPLFDGLPWKHEELLAKAREHPLEFSQMTLALSTREGTALAPPQAKFTDTDLTNARYLKWNATFKNLLAGLEGRDEKVEARFYDPNGLQIASSDTESLCRTCAENRRLQRRGVDADDDRQAARHLQGGALLGRQDARAGRIHRQPGPERKERGGRERGGALRRRQKRSSASATKKRASSR